MIADGIEVIDVALRDHSAGVRCRAHLLVEYSVTQLLCPAHLGCEASQAYFEGSEPSVDKSSLGNRFGLPGSAVGAQRRQKTQLGSTGILDSNGLPPHRTPHDSPRNPLKSQSSPQINFACVAKLPQLIFEYKAVQTPEFPRACRKLPSVHCRSDNKAKH